VVFMVLIRCVEERWVIGASMVEIWRRTRIDQRSRRGTGSLALGTGTSEP
jgi:hypothetical protein